MSPAFAEPAMQAARKALTAHLIFQNGDAECLVFDAPPDISDMQSRQYSFSLSCALLSRLRLWSLREKGSKEWIFVSPLQE